MKFNIGITLECETHIVEHLYSSAHALDLPPWNTVDPVPRLALPDTALASAKLFLVALGAFIPLVGAPTAMIVAMIVALAALGPIQAAIVGGCIALIGQFEGHFLQPLVMGKQVSLHPVVIALTVTAGTLTAGILGAVVSVPLVAVVWAIFSRMRTLDPPIEADDHEPAEEDVPADEHEPAADPA